MKLTQDEKILVEWAINEGLIVAKQDMVEARVLYHDKIIEKDTYNEAARAYLQLKALYNKVRRSQ